MSPTFIDPDDSLPVSALLDALVSPLKILPELDQPELANASVTECDFHALSSERRRGLSKTA
ncbi:MAG: hypothetical protein HZA31_10355 [Opitutae bacterium]|nr:hypothetical protein [Opitutae bacterium]